MSIEAIHWALNTAPIPTDRKDASALAIVLIGLANHADPTGADAFPAVERLMAYGRISRRTVQRALRSLEELGLISKGDNRYRDAKIGRPDQRPQCYNLTLSTGLSTGSGTGRRADAPLISNGASATTERGVSRNMTGRQHDARIVLNHPGNRPSRERAPMGARPAETQPVCGQCDARESDPVSARVVWLDAERTSSELCPRCHPRFVEGVSHV
ncbi:MAG TPA: helix-turn-helix domain-containing protein [Pseudonocardiaceae bacterium]|nr:helix-turn-helix domain-containing protein [Pseudonocardiaceae bacterium]